MKLKLIAALFCVLMCTYGLHADEMIVGTSKNANIRIFKVEAGEVHFQSGSISRKAPLQRISGVRINSIPEMGQAEDALKNGAATTAVSLFEKALDKAKDELRPLVQARMIAAYDKAGKFGEAVKIYRRVMTNHPSAKALMPRNFPTDDAGRKAALAEIKKQLGFARNNQTKDALAELRDAVESGQAPAVAKEDSQPRGTNTPPRRQTSNTRTRMSLPSGIRSQIESGSANSSQASQIEALTNEWLKRLENSDVARNGDFAFMYYYRGVAEKTQDKKKKAMISMMRVMAHYGETKFAASAALEAAGIYFNLHQQDKGRLQSALQLAQEAEQRAGQDQQVKGAARNLQGKIRAALNALG